MARVAKSFEHATYGPCILRAFSGPLEWLRSASVAKLMRALRPDRPVVPQHYELLDLGTDPQRWSGELIARGYAADTHVLKGPARHVGFIEYCGVPVGDPIRKARRSGERTVLLALLESLHEALGILHSGGVIADDTHWDQFTADAKGSVFRIDLDNARPLDIRDPTHPAGAEVALLDRLSAQHPGIFLSRTGFAAGVRVEFEFIERLATTALSSDEQLRDAKNEWERLLTPQIEVELRRLRSAYEQAARDESIVALSSPFGRRPSPHLP